MKNRFRGLSESRKLEMLKMSVEEIYNAGYEAGSKIVAGIDFGSGKDFTPVVKSPNQRRAELIQRARVFVERHERDLPGRWDCRDYGNMTCRSVQYETEFIVKGRKVIALIYTVQGLRKRVRSYKRPSLIGRAKCHPDEVFTADIGKAIALARALEIGIPQEFMEAVQPDEIVSGMVIDSSGALFTATEHTGRCSFASTAKILDDTHAQYEVPSC